ncbi:DUF4199 domain-containing protein [Ekhidna sp. To15]|uniref:DUF4199 domain-containing protein n=1 Tax=Ekhidna sp. To15 TaxID=3395267 RepID=UPI003F524D91
MNKKIALKYGLISGSLIVSSWFITLGLEDDPDFGMAEVLGYAIMIAALSAVFLGIKKIRDEKGAISFKEAFFNGLGITLVASVIYVIGWMIYMPNFAPDFVDKYRASQIELIEQSDIAEEEKMKEINEMDDWMESYKKPHVMIAMTFTEIFPIGVLITLISSLILKRK